jgi:hypothetical protein
MPRHKSHTKLREASCNRHNHNANMTFNFLQYETHALKHIWLVPAVEETIVRTESILEVFSRILEPLEGRQF